MKLISPRESFRRTPEANRYAEIISDPAFAAGLEQALLQFSLDQPRADQWEPAARAHYALQGAKEFASLLLNLVEPPETSPPKPAQNLTWNKPSQVDPGPATPRKKA